MLTALILGFFAFGWMNCVSNSTVSNATPITRDEKAEHNYIGWKIEDVIQKMGPPHKRGRCRIKLPNGINDPELVMSDAAQWHFDSESEGKFTYYMRETCALRDIVVVDITNMVDKTAEGKSTMEMEYVDYVLIRKLLEDGKNGRYILKPGEMEI